jgi:hypothetical protein
MGLWKYRLELHTSYQSGTTPDNVARGAREHLDVEATVERDLSIDDLARLTNGTQRYADARHTAVVFHVATPLLARMQADARLHGLPMFSTIVKNSVIYVP